MPVHFRRIRIAGFKSFAEPVSVEIHAGLTGIVGPNGCGKSNVVEALRWAMGEQSTRSLRAGEMDDVIFAGTAGRASRNLAEVSLTLDDTAGAVPPPFNEQSELEIIRRIERGSGSEYRVNGKEVRARDVQTLFADLATGAHSSGMVSQGRVGALVTAKPEDRRAVLEEAAGITGLHVRRHEAELKLRAAETNLARADDLRGQLEVQLGALKRQARQASRYRNISGAVRQAEAEFLAIQRARTALLRAEAEAALHDARMAVAAATEAATQAATTAADAAAALPPLRSTELDARTALERHRVTQEQIAAEEERARTALADATVRLAQLGQDLAHAEQLRKDFGGGRVAARGAGCRAGGGRRRLPGAVGGRRSDSCGSRRSSPHRGSGLPSRLRCSGRGQRSGPDGDETARGCGAALAAVGSAIGADPHGARSDRLPGNRSRGAGDCAKGTGGCRIRSGVGSHRARRRGAGSRGNWSSARHRARATDRRRCDTRQACRGGACAGRSAGGEGWRALAAHGRCAERSRWPGNSAWGGFGRGAHLSRRPRRGTALARTAAVRPGTQTAGWRDAAGSVGPGAPGTCARAVADRTGGGSRHRRVVAGGSGAGSGAGLARGRRLAVGRLYHPRRDADSSGRPAKAAQPAVAAAA